MTAKPRKSWRVILTGPDSPADTAKVMQWEGGRWWHFETVHADDIPWENR